MPTPQANQSNIGPLEAALDYLGRGYAPIDLPYRSKNPNRPDWQNERHGTDQLQRRFSSNGQLHGVGILLGDPSAGLVDIDLDAPEAIALADAFLPQTKSIFGRPGKLRSHRVYVVSPILPTKKFTDPLIKPGDSNDESARMLVEFRSTGTHTVFPPSVHESGESIEWVTDDEPTRLGGHELLRSVSKLAAASLLMRYWPRRGSEIRHDCALALAGALLRGNWSVDETTLFIGAVVRGAGDEEPQDRIAAVITTAARLERGGTATGLPKLRELLGDAVVARVAEWLQLHTSALPPGAAPDATPIWQPRFLLSAEEEVRAARNTFVDEYVAYASRRTDAPAAFHESLALLALSTVVGRRAVLRLVNASVYPILWVLILADSSIYRKSTAMDLMRELVEHVNRDLLAPNDFTPQRFVAILAEHDGEPLLFVRDEWSGFYDGLNRLDFMAGLKEALCNVYDGRPFRREKMRPKESATKPKGGDWQYDVREPFLSQAVATTDERFSEVARAADVHSGFLVRYGIVLPPITPAERQPIRMMDEALEHERDALATRLQAVAVAEIQLTCEPEVLARFNQYTADIEDEARTAPDSSLVAIVGARVSWMALRIAMLLAVADQTQRVSSPHLSRGIEVTEGWRHNALKVLGALAPSKFEKRIARVVQLVERAGERGLGRREVMRAIKATKREMDDIEATVRERGDIRIAIGTTSGGLSTRYYPTLSLMSPLSPDAFSANGASNPGSPPGDNVDNGDTRKRRR